MYHIYVNALLFLLFAIAFTNGQTADWKIREIAEASRSYRMNKDYKELFESGQTLHHITPQSEIKQTAANMKLLLSDGFDEETMSRADVEEKALKEKVKEGVEQVAEKVKEEVTKYISSLFFERYYGGANYEESDIEVEHWKDRAIQHISRRVNGPLYKKIKDLLQVGDEEKKDEIQKIKEAYENGEFYLTETRDIDRKKILVYESFSSLDDKHKNEVVKSLGKMKDLDPQSKDVKDMVVKMRKIESKKSRAVGYEIMKELLSEYDLKETTILSTVEDIIGEEAFIRKLHQLVSPEAKEAKEAKEPNENIEKNVEITQDIIRQVSKEIRKHPKIDELYMSIVQGATNQDVLREMEEKEKETKQRKSVFDMKFQEIEFILDQKFHTNQMETSFKTYSDFEYSGNLFGKRIHAKCPYEPKKTKVNTSCKAFFEKMLNSKQDDDAKADDAKTDDDAKADDTKKKEEIVAQISSNPEKAFNDLLGLFKKKYGRIPINFETFLAFIVKEPNGPIQPSQPKKGTNKKKYEKKMKKHKNSMAKYEEKLKKYDEKLKKYDEIQKSLKSYIATKQEFKEFNEVSIDDVFSNIAQLDETFLKESIDAFQKVYKRDVIDDSDKLIIWGFIQGILKLRKNQQKVPENLKLDFFKVFSIVEKEQLKSSKSSKPKVVKYNVQCSHHHIIPQAMLKRVWEHLTAALTIHNIGFRDDKEIKQLFFKLLATLDPTLLYNPIENKNIHDATKYLTRFMWMKGDIVVGPTKRHNEKEDEAREKLWDVYREMKEKAAVIYGVKPNAVKDAGRRFGANLDNQTIDFVTDFLNKSPAHLRHRDTLMHEQTHQRLKELQSQADDALKTLKTIQDSIIQNNVEKNKKQLAYRLDDPEDRFESKKHNNRHLDYLNYDTFAKKYTGYKQQENIPLELASGFLPGSVLELHHIRRPYQRVEAIPASFSQEHKEIILNAWNSCYQIIYGRNHEKPGAHLRDKREIIVSALKNFQTLAAFSNDLEKTISNDLTKNWEVITTDKGEKGFQLLSYQQKQQHRPFQQELSNGIFPIDMKKKELKSLFATLPREYDHLMTLLKHPDILDFDLHVWIKAHKNKKKSTVFRNSVEYLENKKIIDINTNTTIEDVEKSHDILLPHERCHAQLLLTTFEHGRNIRKQFDEYVQQLNKIIINAAQKRELYTFLDALALEIPEKKKKDFSPPKSHIMKYIQTMTPKKDQTQRACSATTTHLNDFISPIFKYDDRKYTEFGFVSKSKEIFSKQLCTTAQQLNGVKPNAVKDAGRRFGANLDNQTIDFVTDFLNKRDETVQPTPFMKKKQYSVVIDDAKNNFYFASKALQKAKSDMEKRHELFKKSDIMYRYDDKQDYEEGLPTVESVSESKSLQESKDDKHNYQTRYNKVRKAIINQRRHERIKCMTEVTYLKQKCLKTDDIKSPKVILREIITSIERILFEYFKTLLQDTFLNVDFEEYIKKYPLERRYSQISGFAELSILRLLLNAPFNLVIGPGLRMKDPGDKLDPRRVTDALNPFSLQTIMGGVNHTRNTLEVKRFFKYIENGNWYQAKNLLEDITEKYVQEYPNDIIRPPSCNEWKKCKKTFIDNEGEKREKGEYFRVNSDAAQNYFEEYQGNFKDVQCTPKSYSTILDARDLKAQGLVYHNIDIHKMKEALSRFETPGHYFQHMHNIFEQMKKVTDESQKTDDDREIRFKVTTYTQDGVCFYYEFFFGYFYLYEILYLTKKKIILKYFFTMHDNRTIKRLVLKKRRYRFFESKETIIRRIADPKFLNAICTGSLKIVVLKSKIDDIFMANICLELSKSKESNSYVDLEKFPSPPGVAEARNRMNSMLFTALDTDKVTFKSIETLIQRGADVNHSNSEGFTPLIIASSKGHEEVVQVLLDAGADVNQAGYTQIPSTPLFVASSIGHVEVVKRLIAAGADVNLVDSYGFPPLHIASYKGHGKVVALLIAAGADVKAKFNGWTPLFVASQEGHVGLVQLLINGAVVNTADNYGNTPLLIASGNGHVGVVQLLLENGADINQASPNGYTPLFVASRKGRAEVVRILIKADADVNQTNDEGETALYVASQNGHWGVVEKLITAGAAGADVIVLSEEKKAETLAFAAGKGHKNVIKLLLNNGADVNWASRRGITPLLIAVENEHVGVVEQLLRRGADVNKAGYTPIPSTPLFVASSIGNVGVVAQLIAAADIDVNQADEYGKTPLLIASYKGHVGVVRLLLDKGAVVNKADLHQRTPWSLASKYGKDEVVQLLLENGAEINKADKYGKTPLFVASRRGHVGVVEKLIAADANVNQVERDGVTPLHIASNNGHEGVVQLLLKNGADVNLADEDGATPLYLASKRGHYEVVAKLIAGGADVNILSEDQKGKALYFAADKGHPKVVKALLENGADVNHANENGDTPLLIASFKGHVGVVGVLLENHADANKAYNNEFTPLYIASKFGHANIVQLLIAGGADVNKADRRRQTPLLIASQKGNFEAVQLLLDNGADVNKANKDGDTPFDVASHEEVLRLLWLQKLQQQQQKQKLQQQQSAIKLRERGRKQRQRAKREKKNDD